MSVEKKSKKARKKIQNAVIELLKDHEFSNLKVTDICKKAQINRSTFYDNYQDIYNLAQQLKEYLTQEFIELQEDIHEPNFLLLLEDIVSHQEQYKLFFKLKLQMGLGEKYDDEFNQRSLYEKVFFRSGVTELIQFWLNNGCNESPSEIVQLLTGILKYERII